ncbi:hypothetical protein K438DRAFT_1785645 [Mycena galopus ATCC 62051]|nr:hypothetical protein K438DRAFT_1785645 [Mycena galopus ATCC 62051]
MSNLERLLSSMQNADSSYQYFVLLQPERKSSRELLQRFDSSGLGDIELETCADVWALAWPWIEFLDEYKEAFVGDSFHDQVGNHNVFVQLAHSLRAGSVSGPLINMNRGLYAVVGRAWHCLLADTDPNHPLDISFLLRLHFCVHNSSDPVFENLCIGTGGTYSELTSVVLGHIKCVLPTPRAPITQHMLRHLWAIAQLITGYQDVSFEQALQSASVLAPLVTAAHALFYSTITGVLDPGGSIAGVPWMWATEPDPGRLPLAASSSCFVTPFGTECTAGRGHTIGQAFGTDGGGPPPCLGLLGPTAGPGGAEAAGGSYIWQECVVAEKRLRLHAVCDICEEGFPVLPRLRQRILLLKEVPEGQLEIRWTPGSTFTHEKERVATSAGKIELNLMQVREGGRHDDTFHQGRTVTSLIQVHRLPRHPHPREVEGGHDTGEAEEYQDQHNTDETKGETDEGTYDLYCLF